MKKLKNRNWKIICLCVFSFLLLFAVVVFGVDKIPHDGVRIFLSTLLSTVATVLLANVLWEFIAKESFASSLMEIVSISKNIADSGVEAVYVDFLEINWKKLLQESKTLCVVVTYATTWRESNRSHLRNFLKEKGNKLTVILPDPEIQPNLDEYGRRFNLSPMEVKKRIEDSVLEFYQMGAHVYLYPGTMSASYYIFDNVGIMSFYNHQKKKSTVPAIKAERHGKLYSFLDQEIQSLKSQSAKVETVTSGSSDSGRIIKIGR